MVWEILRGCCKVWEIAQKHMRRLAARGLPLSVIATTLILHGYKRQC